MSRTSLRVAAFRVTVEEPGSAQRRSFECARSQTILDAANAAAIDLPNLVRTLPIAARLHCVAIITVALQQGLG